MMILGLMRNIGQASLFGLVPLALLTALLSGGLIGLLAWWTLAQLAKIGWLDRR